jgi:hypothetical protein
VKTVQIKISGKDYKSWRIEKNYKVLKAVRWLMFANGCKYETGGTKGLCMVERAVSRKGGSQKPKHSNPHLFYIMCYTLLLLT